MRTRQHTYIASNSLIYLAVIVCIGVLITTVAQAGGVPTPYLSGAEAAMLESGVSSADAPTTNWLFPSKVRMSVDNGVYKMQFSTSDRAERPGGLGKLWANRFNLILSIGYSEDDSKPVYVPHDDNQSFGLTNQNFRSGNSSALFMMSVGRRW